jgi:DNA excision repair protein ERCC-5
MALHAIGQRSQPPIRKPVQRRIKSKPLFEPDGDDDVPRPPIRDELDDMDDPELALAIQASLEDRAASHNPGTLCWKRNTAKF